MAATSGSIFASSAQPSSALRSISSNKASQPVPSPLASNFLDYFLSRSLSEKKKVVKTSGKACAAMAVATSVVEEIKEFALPSWAMFELGNAPVYWKTMNGLPPISGERLRIFYNPAATNLTPNDEFGIAFNGFNQPIMCGGDPRAMQKKARGKADSPIYSIQICIPKHVDWDGSYRLQFQVPKSWQNKPIEFFNEGLAEESSREGACERAIFPDASIIVDRSAMIGNLSKEGGDRCNLNLVLGCTDPSSPLYNPFANVDDGSCLIDTEDED